MARSASKPAAAAPSAGGPVAQGDEAILAASGAPKFVRLLGIATRSGGVLLPVGKSLEVGIQIPLALAEARLAEGTAEIVQGSAITAQVLRSALGEMVRHLRGLGEMALAAAEGASDAELLTVIETSRFDASDDTQRLAEALDEALHRHRLSIEAETAPVQAEAGAPA